MSNNAERIFEQLFSGTYAHKNDQLRLIDDEIYSRGTLIGRIDNNSYDDGYNPYLVLSLQRFKSQKNWSKQQKQLAKAANEAGIPVIIIPELDIGFGLENNKNFIELVDYQSNNLIEVAKYSQDEDIKTAACAIKPGYCETSDEILAYSYNQYIDGEWRHAEEILCNYLQDMCLCYEPLEFHSLLEPCYDCLERMIELGGDIILFGALHKDKWNTYEYLQYINDIFNGSIKSNSGRRITYVKRYNKQVNKFYKLEDKQ